VYWLIQVLPLLYSAARPGGLNLQQTQIRIIAKEEAAAEHKKKVADEVIRPINWYRTLIDMNNHVYIIDNAFIRKAADHSPQRLAINTLPAFSFESFFLNLSSIRHL
jgi:hypothetical protein